MLIGCDGSQGIADIFRVEIIPFRTDGTNVLDDIRSFLDCSIISLKKNLVAALRNDDPEGFPDNPEDFLESAVEEIGLFLAVEFDFYYCRGALSCMTKVTKVRRPSEFFSLIDKTSASFLVLNSPTMTLCNVSCFFVFAVVTNDLYPFLLILVLRASASSGFLNAPA
jgi:hypothetical protein